MQIRRKSRPGEKPQYLAHSLYSPELGALDPGRYRSTPSGAPDVAALVHPGMVIRTYGTGGTVIGVEGPYVDVAPDGRTIRISRSSMCRPSGSAGTACSIATGSTNASLRILKLLEANLDEVFTEGAVAAPR
jgi:hypothetical protein